MPEPRHGEVLVKVAYLSLDPYQRGRMRDAASYAAPVGLGEVMTGGIVGEVVKSNNPRFAVGDIVEDRLGWQEYAIGGAASMRKVDPSLAPISTANGVLGMPGMTAYFGLLDVGQPKPGETIVVSAASGAVGQVVGQIGKIMGCRVVGIAGGAKKCAFVKDELGFDACVDYKAEKDLDAALRAACPNGIDVYFDNVGGEISDAVLRNINFFGRVALCGSISQYNATDAADGPAPARHLRRQAGARAGLHRHRLRRQVRAGDAPDGRVDQERQAQVPRGRGAGHRQGAARLHRPAARRELRQDAGEDVDELRRALRRPEGRRSQPGHRRALLRHAAGPARRRRDQGRGPRRRRLGAHARHALRQPFGLLDHRQSRQAQHRASTSRRTPARRSLWRLLEGADVLPRRLPAAACIQRLGFDYEAVAAREPRILYVSISGFGQTGPLAERPAMDPVLQAYTGLMTENRGEDGIPHRVPVIVVDMSTALYAFQALSAALYARRDETRGRYIDVSLMQAATALQSIRLMACHLEGGAMKPGGAPGGVFQTADGWMSILAINDRDWRSFCSARWTCRQLADDPRFATPAAAARQRRRALRASCGRRSRPRRRPTWASG